MPNYACIDHDGTIPFWRELGERVHEHDCKYILQLAHGGPAAGHPRPGSRSQGAQLDRASPTRCTASRPSAPRRRSCARSPRAFAARRSSRPRGRPRRRRAARGQRLSLHAVPQLGHQRPERRVRRLAREPCAPPARDTVRAVRSEVGDDFHLQVKISATENADAFLPWLRNGNTLEDSVQVCRWLEEAGVDAIHVSAGSTFPHPDNPAGGLPLPRGRRELRHDDLERSPRLPELRPLPALADQPDHEAALGAPARLGRGRAPAGRSCDQARGRASPSSARAGSRPRP